MKSKIQMLAEMEALVIMGGMTREVSNEMIDFHFGLISPLAVKLARKRALSILERAGYKSPTILQKLGLKKS